MLKKVFNFFFEIYYIYMYYYLYLIIAIPFWISPLQILSTKFIVEPTANRDNR